MIPWVARNHAFPPVAQALVEPDGLLAASTTLDVGQLIDAYRHGIFPWYVEDEPILWWSPNPRLVLRPEAFVVRRSLRKRLRQALESPSVEIRVNCAFASVVRACAAPRADQGGTWITPSMMYAYGELHERGLAHSVETWVDGALVGGLYGVCLGSMFYGESMFSRRTDASKIALSTLVRMMQRAGVALIDCQQQTAHLMSLGAQAISREDFCAHVAQATRDGPLDWTPYLERDVKILLTEL